MGKEITKKKEFRPKEEGWTRRNTYIRICIVNASCMYTICCGPTTGPRDYYWLLLPVAFTFRVHRPFGLRRRVPAREPVAFGWKEIPFLPPEVGPFWRLSLRKCFDPQCQHRQVTVRVSSRRPVAYFFFSHIFREFVIFTCKTKKIILYHGDARNIIEIINYIYFFFSLIFYSTVYENAD